MSLDTCFERIQEHLHGAIEGLDNLGLDGVRQYQSHLYLLLEWGHNLNFAIEVEATGMLEEQKKALQTFAQEVNAIASTKAVDIPAKISNLQNMLNDLSREVE